MNLVLLEPDEVVDGRARLSGRRALHISGVHRAEVGRTLRVGILGGRIGRGSVASVRGDLVELDVAFDEDPPAALACTLVLAMPRPIVLRRLLGAVTALGVKRVVLLSTKRVEKSYWQSPQAGDTAIREALVLGLEQGCDTVLPVVEKRMRFRPFVEDELAPLAKTTVALVAHPEAAAPCPRAVESPFTLVVGPEGGLIEFEVELLREAGFSPVTLGVRPLRVEHAVVALLGRLS